MRKKSLFFKNTKTHTTKPRRTNETHYFHNRLLVSYKWLWMNRKQNRHLTTTAWRNTMHTNLCYFLWQWCNFSLGHNDFISHVFREKCGTSQTKVSLLLWLWPADRIIGKEQAEQAPQPQLLSSVSHSGEKQARKHTPHYTTDQHYICVVRDILQRAITAQTANH